MDLTTSIGAIALAIMIGAASPGPSFFVVARISVASGRSSGFAAALGMALASMFFATLALVGLQVVLLNFHWLYTAFKILGGLYLVWLAFRIWQGSKAVGAQSLGENTAMPERSVWRDFLRGFTTQLANPKTAIVYAGVFAALLPADPPFWTGFVLIPLLFSIELGWYAIVASLFSMQHPRRLYLGFSSMIDRAAAIIIGGLGVSLVSEAIKNP